MHNGPGWQFPDHKQVSKGSITSLYFKALPTSPQEPSFGGKVSASHMLDDVSAPSFDLDSKRDLVLYYQNYLEQSFPDFLHLN